jgi:hypothetical protein
MKTFLTGVIVLFALSFTTTLAEIEPPKPPKTVSELVLQYSKQYGVSSTTMWTVMKCENKELDPTLQSRIITNGKRELSFGLVQIHVPSHPDITLKQATDAEFSIKYLAQQLKKGNGKQWTCYRTYFT